MEVPDASEKPLCSLQVVLQSYSPQIGQWCRRKLRQHWYSWETLVFPSEVGVAVNNFDWLAEQEVLSTIHQLQSCLPNSNIHVKHV